MFPDSWAPVVTSDSPRVGNMGRSLGTRCMSLLSSSPSLWVFLVTRVTGLKTPRTHSLEMKEREDVCLETDPCIWSAVASSPEVCGCPRNLVTTPAVSHFSLLFFSLLVVIGTDLRLHLTTKNEKRRDKMGRPVVTRDFVLHLSLGRRFLTCLLVSPLWVLENPRLRRTKERSRKCMSGETSSPPPDQQIMSEVSRLLSLKVRPLGPKSHL